MKIFQNGYNHIYDAKAHGLSDAPSRGCSQKEMPKDLVHIIDKLEIDEVGLYGHSMGANTAAKASEIMSNVKFMILEDPAGILYKELDSEKRHKKNIKHFENYRLSTHSQSPTSVVVGLLVDISCSKTG